MSERASDLRSNLSKAKGLGASHHGFGHWWMQRLSALALIPLSAWFVYELVNVMLTNDASQASEWFKNGLNASMLVLMIAAMFFHGKLGVQVVIEDYVKPPFAKYSCLLANTFFCFALGAVSVLAVLKLHFAG